MGAIWIRPLWWSMAWCTLCQFQCNWNVRFHFIFACVSHMVRLLYNNRFLFFFWQSTKWFKFGRWIKWRHRKLCFNHTNVGTIFILHQCIDLTYVGENSPCHLVLCTLSFPASFDTTITLFNSMDLVNCCVSNVYCLCYDQTRDLSNNHIGGSIPSNLPITLKTL